MSAVTTLRELLIEWLIYKRNDNNPLHGALDYKYTQQFPLCMIASSLMFARKYVIPTSFSNLLLLCRQP
jgi:hypothetical protein